MPAVSDHIFQSLTGMIHSSCKLYLTKLTAALNKLSQSAQYRLGEDGEFEHIKGHTDKRYVYLTGRR